MYVLSFGDHYIQLEAYMDIETTTRGILQSAILKKVNQNVRELEDQIIQAMLALQNNEMNEVPRVLRECYNITKAMERNMSQGIVDNQSN